MIANFGSTGSGAARKQDIKMSTSMINIDPKRGKPFVSRMPIVMLKRNRFARTASGYSGFGGYGDETEVTPEEPTEGETTEPETSGTESSSGSWWSSAINSVSSLATAVTPAITTLRKSNINPLKGSSAAPKKASSTSTGLKIGLPILAIGGIGVLYFLKKRKRAA